MQITLVLIGAASLASCGKSVEPEIRRDEYASLQDCLADWDAKAEHCSAEVADSRQTGQTSRATTNFPYYTRYYGPSYNYHPDGRRDYHSSNLNSRSGFSSGSSSRAPSKSIGSSSVSRSGFGSSARASSSGS
jgi:uncharacterized protein YgiB involved in biofilm formation